MLHWWEGVLENAWWIGLAIGAVHGFVAMLTPMGILLGHLVFRGLV